MKHLRAFAAAIGLLITSLLFLNSCQKDASLNAPEGQQRVRIRLSDNPIPFDAVNVDIQRVEVKVVPDSCRSRDDHDDDDDDDDDDHDNNSRCAVWDTLDIREGVYNLLNLTNGTDTLLASGYTIAGRITQIRLTLGTGNNVVIDGVTYPLTLWNNRNTVTIHVKGEHVDEISPDDLQLWLDFDAGRSIVKVNNNRFVLKPYLRLWVPARTATIRGKVVPREARAVVSVVSNNDTLVALPERNDGRFKIRGITGSTADVYFNATANGYRDTTIYGVQLTRGRETDIGTIELRQ